MVYTNQFLLLIKEINKNKPCAITEYLNTNNIETNITWVDIKDDTVSFILDKKINKKINLLNDWEKKAIENPIEFERIVKLWVSNKELSTVDIKIGRFVKKLTKQFSDAEIEHFVNKYKAFVKLKKETTNFEIISGEKIRYYYNENSYQYKYDGKSGGQLSLSCMRYEECQVYFDIYIQNSEICKLIILKGFDTDKIIGRALLWTLNTGELYLDRVYTSYDCDIILFEQYAKQLGCKLFYEEIIKQSSEFVELTIKPKYIDFEEYPFMDTFRYFYPSKKIFNSEIIIGNNAYYDMDTTNGKLSDIISNRNLPPLRHSLYTNNL